MLFPNEALAALIFSVLACFLGAGAFDFDLDPIISKITRAIKDTYISINCALGDPEDKLTRMTDRLIEMIKEIPNIKVSCENWDISDQWKSIVEGMTIMTTFIILCLSAATTLTSLFIAPYLY